MTSQDWRDDAACKDSPTPSLWFPMSSTEAVHNYPVAAAICAGCPVKTACLEFALAGPERWGMWAGLREDQREALRRRRQPSRSGR